MKNKTDFMAFVTILLSNITDVRSGIRVGGGGGGKDASILLQE